MRIFFELLNKALMHIAYIVVYIRTPMGPHAIIPSEKNNPPPGLGK